MWLTTVAAATAAGLAAWLATPGAALGSDAPRTSRPRKRRWRVRVLVLACATGALTSLVEGETLALGLVLLAGASGVWLLAERVRSRREAQTTADRVVEVCEALAGELRAGQPPVRALRHGVEVWPELAPVASAGELGADVPDALRRLAERPGAGGLVEVAGAWQVSQRAGSTMAPALGRVADAARRRRATERLVAAELASAQATARLVAVLPVAVLAMGSGLGGDPWGFLLRTPVGIGCLAMGLGLGLLGLSWIERIAARAVS